MDEKIEEMAMIALKNTMSYTCAKQIAMNFYNAGYRKESNTARELAKTIKSVVWEEFENETIRIKDLHGVIDDILRSKYGVDLGE